jgi:hypothetical protein
LGIPILFLWTLPAALLGAQQPGEVPAAVAWGVRGVWHVQGRSAPVLQGDAIPPGSLLSPSHDAAAHSIDVLMPDGQSIIYECFTVNDCARGFRVPMLNLTPEPFAIDMLTRIRTVLVRENRDTGDRDPSASIHRARPLPRDEVAAELGPDNGVQVAGLAAKLANGHYTYDLRPLDRSHPRQFHIAVEKNGPSIAIQVPAAGLYTVTIADDQNTPRIDLFIAAVNSAQAANITKSFTEAKSLLRKWIESNYGWPIHAFQWAYLESIALGEQPVSGAGPEAAAARVSSPVSSVDNEGRTAEPAFSPTPGWLHGDAAITLRCDTPGATMHYTVDGSQPTASSAVYGAPIIVKATGLTIMAFSSAPGKKDSAVVTGNFRIRH